MKIHQRCGGVLLAAALVAAPVVAGETGRVEGLEFDQIIVLGSVSVEIQQGDSTVLKLQASEGDIKRGPFYLRDNRLVLGANPNHRRYDFGDVKFKVEVPTLRRLHLKGSGDVWVKPFVLVDGEADLEVSLDGSGDIRLYGVETHDLTLQIKGDGDIKAVDVRTERLDGVVAGAGDLYFKHVHAQEAAFVVTGSGDIAAVEDGDIGSVEVNIIGSGDIDLSPLTVGNVEANIIGSGMAKVGTVTGTLNCSILGSGDVRFRGDPKVDSVQFGSGECRQRN